MGSHDNLMWEYVDIKLGYPGASNNISSHYKFVVNFPTFKLMFIGLAIDSFTRSVGRNDGRCALYACFDVVAGVLPFYSRFIAAHCAHIRL